MFELLKMLYLHEVVNDSNYVVYQNLVNALNQDGKNPTPDLPSIIQHCTDEVPIESRIGSIECVEDIRNNQTCFVDALIETYANSILVYLVADLNQLSQHPIGRVVVLEGELAFKNIYEWSLGFIEDEYDHEFTGQHVNDLNNVDRLREIVADYSNVLTMFDTQYIDNLTVTKDDSKYADSEELVQRYYEWCEPETIMIHGALPRWAVKMVFSYLYRNERLRLKEHVHEFITDFEVINSKLLREDVNIIGEYGTHALVEAK